MFFDEIDRDMGQADVEDQREARSEKRSFIVLGLVAVAWLVVLLVSGQGEMRAGYDRCIAAGGDTVECSMDPGAR